MPFDDTVQEIPQAATEGIARRLLGDDLVNRYGDVMGARKTTAADVLRDFTIGFRHGQEKVDELHMKVQDTARKAYNKQAEKALASKQQDIQTTKAAWQAATWISEHGPAGYKEKMLKEQWDKLGVTYTPTTLKMFADADFLAQLPQKDIDKGIEDGTIDTSMLNAFTGDSMKASQFRSEAMKRKRDEADTNRMILGAEGTRIKQQRDRLKLKQEKQAYAAGVPQAKDTLSITNAQLNADVKRQKLAKGNGGVLEKLLSGQGLGMTDTPLDPNAGEQAVAGVEAPTTPVAPTPVDPAKVAEIKAKYGMK